MILILKQRISLQFVFLFHKYFFVQVMLIMNMDRFMTTACSNIFTDISRAARELQLHHALIKHNFKKTDVPTFFQKISAAVCVCNVNQKLELLRPYGDSNDP